MGSYRSCASAWALRGLRWGMSGASPLQSSLQLFGIHQVHQFAICTEKEANVSLPTQALPLMRGLQVTYRQLLEDS